MTPGILIAAALIGTTSADDRACELALSEVARAAAERGWQADARCAGRADRRLAAAASLTVDRIGSDALLRSGLMMMVLQAGSREQLQAAQRLAVRVTWIAPAWTVVRARGAGDVLLDEDLKLAPHRWADGVVVQRAEEPRPLGRLRRALRAGDVLTADALVSAQALLRGDRVSAVLQSGGIEVTMPAALLAPARVGDRARVQPAARVTVLEGILVDAFTVKVDAP